MTFYTRIILIFSVCLLSVGCDQITKSMAAEHLPRGEMYSFLNDIFRIGYAENTGAFLSLGSELSPDLRFWLFVVGVGISLGGFAVYLFINKKLTMSFVIGGALLLSGGLSNFYDRLVNQGAVVDFINLGIGPIRTGIFNIADVAIMVGMAIMILAKPTTKPIEIEHKP